MNFSTCHATWKRSVFRALRGPTVEQFCRIVLQSKLCKVSICKTIFCARELHWLGWNYRDVCGRLDCISIGMFTGMSPGNSYGEYSGMSAEGGIPQGIPLISGIPWIQTTTSVPPPFCVMLPLSSSSNLIVSRMRRSNISHWHLCGTCIRRERTSSLFRVTQTLL